MARRRKASLGNELGWHPGALSANIGYGVAGFALASALIFPVALVAHALLSHAPDPSNPVIPQIIDSPGIAGTLVLVILASFAAPPIEELLFRGVFYNAAKLRLGVWPAIVLTGLVFGFVHPVGIADMFALATLGGVFAWMAETRKSLVPSMTTHFLWNLTSTLLLLSLLTS
jgi:membrane protease YdiL (CAAX protease family)